MERNERFSMGDPLENSKFWPKEERKSSIGSDKDSDFAYGWQRDLAKRSSEFTDLMDRNFDKFKNGHSQEELNHWDGPYYMPWEEGNIHGWGRVAPDTNIYGQNWSRTDWNWEDRTLGKVRITVNRLYYGNNTTLSKFTAFAYNAHGRLLTNLSGYFLERETDFDRNTTEGSETAIPAGTYKVKPCQHQGHNGFFEVTGVEGRSAIHIHPGKTWEHTVGCLLPGSSYLKSDEDYIVFNSGTKFKQLRNFLYTYGKGGVTINISL